MAILHQRRVSDCVQFFIRTYTTGLNPWFWFWVWGWVVISFSTRRTARAFARLVLKIQKFVYWCILTWRSCYFFKPYITLFIIVNYFLLLVKTIQIWSTYNNNLICWALIILCILLLLFSFYFGLLLWALAFINNMFATDT